MTFTQLQYILAVNKTRHFANAAKSCFVTQPTLSMQIQKLEEQLGVKIFDRSKSPIKPTRIGEKIIAQARLAVVEMVRIKEVVSDEKGLIVGDLKVGIIPTIAPYLAPLFLDGFCKKYPDVELSIIEMTTETCLKELDEENIDVAVLATSEDKNLYHQESLYDEELYLFVNKNHDLYKKKSVKVSDVRANEIWLLEEGHCLRDEIISICKLRRELKSRPSNMTFRVGNLEALIYIVQDNYGYTLLPKLAIERLNASQKKCVRPFSNDQPSRSVYMTSRRKYLKRNLIEVFTEEVLDSLGGRV